MTQHRIWWQLGLFVLICTAAVSVGMKFDDEMAKYLPETIAQTSTFNAKPSGISGLFDLAKRVGLPCRRWQFAYRRLAEAKGMLVLVGPDQSPQDFELDQVLAWVARGNQLVYLDGFSYTYGRHILTKLGLDAHDSPDAASGVDSRVELSGERPEFANVPYLKLGSDIRLDGGTALASDKSGTLLAVVKHGRGRVLVGAVPGLGCNQHLSEHEDWPNFQFLVNWLGTADGEILFDEICHGYNQATNVFVYLGRGPAGLLAAQALLMLAVALLSCGQRFGSVNALVVARKLSNLEFINGLASTFRRARAASLAWDVLNHSFRLRLCKALGVSPHEENNKLLDAWSQATGKSPEDLALFLASSSSALEKDHMTDEELIALTTACDKISEQSKDLFATGRGKSY